MNFKDRKFLHRVLLNIEREYGKEVRKICEGGFRFYMKWFKHNYNKEEAFGRSISMLDPYTVALNRLRRLTMGIM
jgi:hypothetical protein